MNEKKEQGLHLICYSYFLRRVFLSLPDCCFIFPSMNVMQKTTSKSVHACCWKGCRKLKVTVELKLKQWIFMDLYRISKNSACSQRHFCFLQSNLYRKQSSRLSWSRSVKHSMWKVIACWALPFQEHQDAGFTACHLKLFTFGEVGHLLQYS